MFGKRAIIPQFSALAAQAAHLASAQAVITCISLGYFAIAARKLGPELISIVAIFEAASSLLAVVGSLGTIDVALLRSAELFRNGERSRAIAMYLKAGLVSTASYVVFAIVAAIFPFGKHAFLERSLGPHWPLVLVGAAFLYKLTEIGSSCLMASQRVPTLARIRVLGTLCPRLLGVAAAFAFGPIALVRVHLFGYLFTVVFMAVALSADLRSFRLRTFLRSLLNGERLVSKDNLAYFGNSIARTAFSQLDVVAVGWLFPQRVLGGYFVCKRAFDLLVQYAEPVLSPCIPMIAAGPGTAAARGAIRQAAKIVGFLSNTGMLGVVFFNQAILSVLAGPKFAGFGGILLAFCLLGWLYWFQSFFLSVLYATSPPKRFLQFSAICIVSSLALSITMGWHFGISGFLLGRVAAAAILIGFGGYLTLRDGNVLDSELRLLEKSLVGVVLLCALAFFGRPLLSVRHVFACVAGVIVYYATVHDILFQMASLVFPKVAAAGEERLSIAYGTAIVSADPEAGSSLSVTAK